MTPSERQELEACLKRASKILYNNSDPESLKTFEGIEKTVREQVLEQRKQKITCECGSVHRRDEKYRHLKTKKHQAYVASLCPLAEITL